MMRNAPWRRLAPMLSALTTLGCAGGPVEVNPPTAKPPEVGYRAEDVSFVSEGLPLSGTLFLPDTDSRVPAVVIVSGSGPVDRDGRHVFYPFLLPPAYKLWAERMAQNHIAVLRYDKRFLTHRDIDPLTLSQENQLRDVVAAVNYLRSRAEVDPDRVFIVGHSEGGSLAPVAAARVDVRGVVAVGSPAFAVDSLILTQLRVRGYPEDKIREVEEKFRLLREGKFPKSGEILGAGEAYWREFIEYTERADSIATGLGKPMLVVQGLADEMFPGETLGKNVGLWEGIASRSPRIEFRTYEGVTHALLAAPTEEVSAPALDAIVRWVERQ